VEMRRESDVEGADGPDAMRYNVFITEVAHLEHETCKVHGGRGKDWIGRYGKIVTSHRWQGPEIDPSVHRLDAAHLFRLALENGAAGARYHAVAEEGVPVRKIAEVISQRLNVPVVGKSSDEAAKHFSWLAPFLPVDNPTSSRLTQERLGWRPTSLS
jgi:hypothetical protein